jgi:hypothetical protein
MKRFFHFAGRGNGLISDDKYYHLEPDEGAVLLITKRVGKVEFILGFCREAIIERWGCYCMHSFRRASSPDLSRSWSVPEEAELMIYHSVTVYLVREEDWMRQSN